MGQFFGQVHGNLTRPGNAGRALFGVHVGDLDLVVIGHRFLNVFDADLAVLNGQQVAQGFTCQLDGNFLLVKTRIGQDFAQCTFKFPHVRTHVLGHKEGHLFWHDTAFTDGLVDQNGHPHFKLGRFNGHREARIKSGNQALMDVGQAFGIGVAGHHNVRLFGQQGLKGVEKLFLGAIFVGKELHVVNEEQIERVVTVLELVKCFALIGFNHIRHKLLSVNVENFGVGPVSQQLVSHRMHQVGLTQTHATVDEKRVVKVAGHGGYMHGCSAGHAVGRAFHQGVKSEGRVQTMTMAIGGRFIWRIDCFGPGLQSSFRH